MSRSYRVGIQIVLATILVSAIVCGIGVSRTPADTVRASHDLGADAWPLGDFRFFERSGRAISQNDLGDRVWIASFIFTRCPLSCPRISTVMKGLQGRLGSTNVLLVSISVDPDHDTPAVLKEYADRFGARADRWWFLTGSRASTYDLVRGGFKLALAESTTGERGEGAEEILHSDRLALVDRGRVVGFFDSSEPRALDDLVTRASRLAQPNWVLLLPSVNAGLNAFCAVLLITGWLFIRQRRFAYRQELSGQNLHAASQTNLLDQAAVRAHIVCMLLAVTTSAIFLACYLTYHYHAGSMPFRHPGAVRWLYLTILLSHTLLATFGVVPLVALTLFRAATGDFAKHSRIAQVTFPIWLYVSVTGVVIYLLLYHMPLAATSTPALLPA